MIIYLDDILLLASFQEEIDCHSSLLLKTLTALGFLINTAKSILKATQRLEFLEFVADSLVSLRDTSAVIVAGSSQALFSLSFKCQFLFTVLLLSSYIVAKITPGYFTVIFPSTTSAPSS